MGQEKALGRMLIIKALVWFVAHVPKRFLLKIRKVVCQLDQRWGGSMVNKN